MITDIIMGIDILIICLITIGQFYMDYKILELESKIKIKQSISEGANEK